MHMPAFTFEKLSSRVRRSPTPPDEEKQRSRLGQLLGRFAEMRMKRLLRRERIVVIGEQTSSENISPD
jgi:hypothetical protein